MVYSQLMESNVRPSPAQPLHRRDQSHIPLLVMPFLLGLIALPLYLAFRSLSLDDFDSYSFALALETFSLKLQQPQPPGFPVYVAAGRALYALTHDPVTALTTLSALSGGLTVILVYGLGRALLPYHPAAAAFAALLFAFAPVSWLTADKALSDTPGMMWTLLALWLWVRWRKPADDITSVPATPPLLASVMTGIALGVRPQNALPLVLLLSVYIIRDLVHRRSLSPWIIAFGGGIAGVVIWLIPVARAAGGLPPYVKTMLDHAAHVGRADALAGMGRPLFEALRIRALALLDTTMTAVLGGGLYPPQPVNVSARALALGSVTLLGLLWANWRRRTTRWLAIWALATGLQVFFFETLDRPRLLLPVLPPLTLLVASGWSRLGMRSPPVVRGGTPSPKLSRMLSAGVMTAAAWLLMLWSIPLVAQVSQVPAPPLQAAHFVREHYPPEQTLVAAAGSFRAAQVELPDYALVYLYQFDPEETAAVRNAYRSIVIFDRDQLTPAALDVLSAGGRWVTVEDRTFSRDRRVHTQHDQVRLQVLSPPNLVSPEALMLPSDGCIDIGGENDGRYLGQGWFRPEEIAGSAARWAGQTITTSLRVNLATEEAIRVRLRALAFPAQQTVTLYQDQSLLNTVDLAQDWTEAELMLPARRASTSPIITLTLVHATAQSPQDSTGASSDTRLLTAAYDWFCFAPVTTPVTASAAPPGQSRP